jgi:hypothetical protein
MSTQLPVRAAATPAAFNRLRLALLGIAAATIAACGGGSMDVQPQSCSDCGTAMLTMTDAAGDFLGYSVDLTSLELTKANGTSVQTLPATTRIDFAQLVDLSEVLSTGQVPVGEYVAATLKVDFSHAAIIADDGAGTGVQLSPVDANGQPLGQVELMVKLDNRNHLMINSHRISHLAFDLDLLASNTVDMGAHTVTVSPFVVASVQPVERSQVRARGRLDSVDVPGSSYTINLRPFHEDAGSSGQMTIHTTSTTRFEINGMVLSGVDGLTALSNLDGHPATIAFGSVDAGEGHAFTAKRVLAATSAQDLHHDYLSGNVLARAGNVLTLGGVRVGRHGGGAEFELGHVAVTVGPDTRVTRDGQASGVTLGIADISVGQRLEVFGDYSRDGGHAALDATAGRVRLNYTHLFGTVATNAGGMLTLGLESIDGREPARFDFTGTGTTPATDADPAHYEVLTGALDTTGVAVGAWTRLFGFVTPFGAAPPDFIADTFLDFTQTRVGVALNWGLAGSTAPFTSSTTAGLVVNPAGMHGAVQLGGRLVDVTTLASLTLQPATEGTLVFAIAHRSSHDVENFSDFADFVVRLNAVLDGSKPLYRVDGQGSFNAVGGVFTATRLLVVVGD